MNQTSEKGLEFNGRLPLAVEKIGQLPSAAELVMINNGNEQLLRTVMLLEEKPEGDEDDRVLQELKKQDMKINLLLDMLSTLLLQNAAMPPACDLTLTDSWMRLSADDAAGVSGACCVKLYINSAIPRPLLLFGHCDKDADTAQFHIQFYGMSQSLVDGLDKYIFRFHRRMVANSRTV